MTFWKLLTYINWLLTVAWAAMVLYYLTLPNGPTDAAGQGAESAIKGMCVFMMPGLIGLNRLPLCTSIDQPFNSSQVRLEEFPALGKGFRFDISIPHRYD